MMITARDIADFLGAALHGPNVPVIRPRSLLSAESGSIVFMSRPSIESIEKLKSIGNVTCILAPGMASQMSGTAIEHDDPRLAFCLTLQHFFAPPQEEWPQGERTIAPDARIGPDVSIGAGARIGSKVRIGARTRIGCNVVIMAGASIGEDCDIKANTTIGEGGFSHAPDAEGNLIRFPHLGSVLIGNNVEIGANCTVVRAALDETRLDDHVKTDDHVHIAHNCIIGARTRITAGVVLSGSVTVGRDAWLSPNCTIIDYATIGDGAFVGIGSVVTKSVPAGSRVFGVPARPIKGGGPE